MLKMDLDNFKLVNETLGHAEGDEAIRFYCSITKRVFGRSGEVYRRGGDEVVILAPDLELAVAKTLAEDLRAEIEREFHAWGSQRELTRFPTASIGLAVAIAGISAADIARTADEAQARAKKEGKNRVVFSHLTDRQAAAG